MTAVFYLFLFEYLFHNILKSTIRKNPLKACRATGIRESKT